MVLAFLLQMQIRYRLVIFYGMNCGIIWSPLLGFAFLEPQIPEKYSTNSCLFLEVTWFKSPLNFFILLSVIIRLESCSVGEPTITLEYIAPHKKSYVTMAGISP